MAKHWADELLNPLRILVLGYAIITVLGAVLLSLPISTATGACQPFIDALFVSVSGISTSGLSVVDIGSYYSLFGQIVLMCIFQIGGIGYMTFVVFVLYRLGEKMSIKTHIIAKESLATDSFHMLGTFFKNVLLCTAIFEGIGAVILTLYWWQDNSFLRASYLGIFHSISAFCTAGFSPFSTSLMPCRDSWTVNLTVDIISLIGGIGFFVLIDLVNFGYKKQKKLYPARLSLHSKIVLLTTLSLILIGAFILLTAEKWPHGMSFGNKLLISFFQSVSASTTDGFNSVDIGAMSATSLTVLMMLMFIGASPGSTGGGIKTSTIAILCATVKAHLEDREQVNVFHREIPAEAVIKSFTLFGLFLVIMLADVLIMVNTEKATYLQVLFEIVSALGNTGLSMGITSQLTFLGKLILIITMFVGRVGPLTIGAAIMTKKEQELYRYPRGNLFIG